VWLNIAFSTLQADEGVKVYDVDVRSVFACTLNSQSSVEKSERPSNNDSVVMYSTDHSARKSQGGRSKCFPKLSRTSALGTMTLTVHYASAHDFILCFP
jgi:hypothetical protein